MQNDGQAAGTGNTSYRDITPARSSSIAAMIGLLLYLRPVRSGNASYKLFDICIICMFLTEFEHSYVSSMYLQILHVFGGSLLRRTYQLLKLVHSSDPDPTTRTQAQSGIERLNGVMKQFLTPVCTKELKKTLYVMDTPPDPFDWRL